MSKELRDSQASSHRKEARFCFRNALAYSIAAASLVVVFAITIWYEATATLSLASVVLLMAVVFAFNAIDFAQYGVSSLDRAFHVARSRDGDLP